MELLNWLLATENLETVILKALYEMMENAKPSCSRVLKLRLPSQKLIYFAAVLLLIYSSEAYDPLDPNGNVTIKWDIMSWKPDGYVALVTIINYQQYRHIEPPGWSLSWNWNKNEIIWEMTGAQAALQGDCSKFTDIPHCCKRNPTIVDLIPGVPYNLQTANCCRSGLLSSFSQDKENYIATFQITVGLAGNSNTTVLPPWNFAFRSPGAGYTCSAAKRVESSLFPTPDGRRHTQALMTWNVTCKYAQFLVQRAPACCVSFSSFYNDTIIPCQTCACNCQNDITRLAENAQPICVDRTDTSVLPRNTSGLTLESPQMFCSRDMCPVKIHWHVKANYYDYWRAKVTITNRNLLKNFTQWNLMIQHPNFSNLTYAFSFNYRGLSPYGDINDTAMLWGIKYYNDILSAAGTVQSELLFRKNSESQFSFRQGWGFPHRVFFNGDECVLPSPDAYPWLPNRSTQVNVCLRTLVTALVAAVYFIFLL